MLHASILSNKSSTNRARNHANVSQAGVLKKAAEKGPSLIPDKAENFKAWESRIVLQGDPPSPAIKGVRW